MGLGVEHRERREIAGLHREAAWQTDRQTRARKHGGEPGVLRLSREAELRSLDGRRRIRDAGELGAQAHRAGWQTLRRPVERERDRRFVEGEELRFVAAGRRNALRARARRQKHGEREQCRKSFHGYPPGPPPPGLLLPEVRTTIRPVIPGWIVQS